MRSVSRHTRLGQTVRFGAALLMTAALFAVFSTAHARAPQRAPLPVVKKLPGEPGSSNVPASDGQRTINAEEARSRLMEQLLRAAEAGIVDLKPSEPAPAEPSDVPVETDMETDRSIAETRDAEQVEGSDAETAAAPTMEASENPTGDATNGAADDVERFRISGLEAEPPVETSSEAPTEPMQASEVQTRPPSRCFSRAQLTLPDVPSDIDLIRHIGELRNQLVGEFDAVDPEPAIELAKIYVATGMLHEARATIAEFAPEHPFGFFLMDVTGAMLGKLDYFEGSLFKDECIGVQALWRAYGQARIGAEEAALRSEVSSGAALEELPLHVRQVVATELGLLAANQGQWETVRRLEAMALRAANGAGETLGRTHLLSYRIATWNEDPAEAQKHLALAGESDIDTATEALLIRAQLALESEDILDKGHQALRLDLGDLARRELGTEVGRKAFELEARLFNRDKGTEETIQFLSDAVDFGLLDDENHSGFLAELIAKPAYSEVERPLAFIYLEDPSRFQNALEQRTLRQSIIRSLAQNGVPGVAFDLARKGDLDTPDLAIDLAESFLQADEMRRAIDILSGLEDHPRQRLILSKAYLQMGDFERSLAVLSDAEVLSGADEELAGEVAALKLKAELAGRDVAAAFETSLKKLDAEGGQKAATEAALIALEAGEDELPASARTVLEGEGGGGLEELERLFSLGDVEALREAETMNDIDEILEDIESGEKAILEVIENG